MPAEGVDGATAAATVRSYGLPWEALPTGLTTSPAVNAALVDRMPIGALVCLLGRLTALGVRAPFSEGTEHACAALGDRARPLEARLHLKARLHLMALLVALRTYASGHGERGRLSWEPVAAVEAPNAAFYPAFAAVEPTGRRLLLALDVSGSIGMGSVAGSGLTPREAAAAMALATAVTEERWRVVGFTADGGCRVVKAFTHLPIGPSMRFD